MDYASQTEPLPEERASQTSTDVEIQTAKVDEYFEAEDKYVVGAAMDMIALLLRHSSSKLRSHEDYGQFQPVFEKAFQICKRKDYWQLDVSDVDDDDSSQDEGSKPVTRQQVAKSN